MLNSHSPNGSAKMQLTLVVNMDVGMGREQGAEALLGFLLSLLGFKPRAIKSPLI